MLKIFIALAASSAIGWWAFRNSLSADFEGIEAPLLAINPTIAVFSVNLALAGYQSSPYRQFYKALSSNQLVVSLLLVLASFGPVLSIVVQRSIASPLALGILPVVGVSSVLLLAVARRETNGLILLKRASRKRRITKYLKRTWKATVKKAQFLKSLPWDKEPGRPTHEWDWRLSPDAVDTDPFMDVSSIALVAVANSDVLVFDYGLTLYLQMMDAAAAYKPKKKTDQDYSTSAAIMNVVRMGFDRIVQGCSDSDKIGLFLHRAMDRVSESLLAKSKSQQQCSDNAFCLLGALESMAERCVSIERGGSSSKFLSTARQVMCEGLTFLDGVEGKKRRELYEFEDGLPSIVAAMGHFGSQMVNARNSSQLYLVLETLSWSGCYGVKYRAFDVTKRCLRVFAQIGREARAAKLECHWDRCAIQPWQHVEEKIFGVVTWMTKISSDEQTEWLSLAQAAYSRLRGFETTVTIEEREGKFGIAVRTSKVPSKLEYMDARAGSRTLDYSDFSMLKDFDLMDTNGGISIGVGPCVPIFPTENGD